LGVLAASGATRPVQAQDQAGQTAFAEAAPTGPFNAYNALNIEEPPVRLEGPALRYPTMLYQAGIEGEVVVEFVIDEDGRPVDRSINIVTSTNRGFLSAAREYVKRSKFRPGRHQGNPVRTVVQQPIAFHLHRP
jgi:TonB family protein